MSRKLPLILLTTLLLTACETAQPKAEHFVGVPLEQLPAADQARVHDLVQARCGEPPVCPADAILESWALKFVKLRALVRAATSH